MQPDEELGERPATTPRRGPDWRDGERKTGEAGAE